MKILLVEDEKISRITLGETLQKEGYRVTACENGREGLEWIEEDQFDVIITDLRLPDADGLQILQAARQRHRDTAVIVITGHGTVETAVSALKLGAYDYLTKPFAPDRLLGMLKNIRQLHDVLAENRQLKKRINRYEDREIIGSSPPMRKLVTTLRSVAATDHTVLIEGESGTGKELAAHFLHQFSERHRGPFIPVNCAVLPEGLLESELFGHEKGAFTGALRRHQGYIERAHCGTLFIDDIDDLPSRLQVKLLRVLQEREVQPVGGREAIPVDFRVLCATKVDLRGMVAAGTFREDLYYRLNIITVTLPPLRDHREDLPVLVDHFLKKYERTDRPRAITPAQIEQMMRYDWPGNVRELENMVQRLLALPPDADFLQLPALNADFSRRDRRPDAADQAGLPIPRLQEDIRVRQRDLIRRAMEQSGNNISAAARLLGLPRTTLQSKLEKMGFFQPEGTARDRP